MFDHMFLNHPRAVEESYGEHFVMASGFGLSMIAAGHASLDEVYARFFEEARHAA